MTLYLKYRSKNLDELDLPDVRESLKKIVSSKQIPHAFLFSGPKGTGKTSAARILAKIINCENLQGINPCEECEQCISIAKGSNLDVVEIDAASNRGIDDVRILRDAVKLSPARAKKKIYIIDEAHMLTVEASNALLKTLEEPPEHVVFILATTNPEKLIETIKSRTTLIPFRKAKVNEIAESLKRVVLGEKIKIDDDALLTIAQASGGAFRDAIKILEQLIIEEKDLSKASLSDILLKNKSSDIDNFIQLLIDKKTKDLIEEVEKIVQNGQSVDIFLKSLILRLKSALFAYIGADGIKIDGLDASKVTQLLELFDEANKKTSESILEELPIELAIVKYCGDEKSAGSDDKETRIEKEKIEVVIDAEPITAKDVLEIQKDVEEMRREIDSESWKSILSTVKPINASVEALLRSSQPISYDGKTLTLGVFYKFHKERLEDAHHRKILEDTIAKVMNAPTKVVCVLVDQPARSAAVLTENKDKDIIRAAEEIFSS